MKLTVSLKDLRDEINQIRAAYPKYKDDSAFVLWFLRALIADSEASARGALTGDTSDKNIDAILIDERAKQVNLIQGKLRHSEKHAEKRNEVLSFAALSNYPWESKTMLDVFYEKLDPLVRERFEELVRRVKTNKYALKLYYVTTGRCSKTICNEAKERVRQAEGPVEISIIDGGRVLTLFKDYLEGVAPAVPTLTLRICSEGSIQNEGLIHRLDPKKGTESWVFTMHAKDVGDMFARSGIRLFARNVRGYLGSTAINDAMAHTIRTEPDNFWYYNNGVTIVCDDVKRETQGGEDVLIVDKPQVINGQQTTRTLYNALPNEGSLLVKVIKIPRHPGDDAEYDELVNSIVRATNWQNHIEASDLVSNDHIQVYIERSLSKLGYQYIRKRQSKSEARRLFGSQGFFQIDKREMAQAVGACHFDPSLVRKGKEGLFENPYYKSIFGSRSMAYYLSRYWLMREVQYKARGYPERAYAKWVVLNFAWKKLSDAIGSGFGERRFRHICERKEWPLWDLDQALDGIFKCARAFFGAERGSGEEAKDVSTFFKLSKLDQRFEEFWNSAKNPRRAKVEARLVRFRDKLNEVELRT